MKNCHLLWNRPLDLSLLFFYVLSHFITTNFYHIRWKTGRQSYNPFAELPPAVDKIFKVISVVCSHYLILFHNLQSPFWRHLQTSSNQWTPKTQPNNLVWKKNFGPHTKRKTLKDAIYHFFISHITSFSDSTFWIDRYRLHKLKKVDGNALPLKDAT